MLRQTYLFVDRECGAKLTLTQHPELMTKSNLTKYDPKLGRERPDHMENFNRGGIATQWYRGNK